MRSERALERVVDVKGWARAVAALPVRGPLPERTVLVPRERVAHALRRALVEMGRPDVLMGTRFVGPLTAAEAVAQGARLGLQPGEEALRAHRLRRMFEEGVALAFFEPDQVRKRAGWDTAFAATLTELEGAGLRHEDLPLDPRSQDLARLWRELDAQAGASVTRGRLWTEAAAALGRDPSLWPHGGPTLAVVTGLEDAAQARFVGAIPRLHLALFAGRPVRRVYLDRVRTLFGHALAEAAASEPDVPGEPHGDHGTPREADLLHRFFLAAPDRIAHANRPRSHGPDGSVHLEEHSGADEELEAAADWVTQEVLAHGTALEDIAVLVPNESWLGPVAARLRRVPWPGGDLPVHVAGGVPFAGVETGARVLTVLRALGRFLDAGSVAGVLPLLRTAQGAPPVGPSDAVQLAWSLGTTGGSRAHPERALDWCRRARAHRERMEAETAEDDGGEAADPVRARHLATLGRQAAMLRALEPALEALVGVAASVVEGAPLTELWPALRRFVDAHVRDAGASMEGAPSLAAIGDAMAPLMDSALADGVKGEQALALVEETARALRVRTARYGAPAVYLGTVAGVAGLPFVAVRVVGLHEGALPSVPQQDPVLPDDARRGLGPTVPTSEHRVLGQLHGLFWGVAQARDRVVLSAPRMSPERTQREPSSVLLEAGVALGRPGPDARRAPVPSRQVLTRDYVAPARHALAAFRRDTPVSPHAWLHRTAEGHAPPPSWAREGALDPERVAALERGGAREPMDGLLGTDVPDWLLPGLTPHRAASASGLAHLLACPHRFLLERVLGLDEPATPPALGQLEAFEYGHLLHQVAETFARRHGAAFGRREGTLARWRAEAEALADVALGELMETRPFLGERVRQQVRRLLVRDLGWFLEHDWNGGQARELVDVERAFGYGADGPVALPVEGGALHVRGRIDRIDQEDDRLLLRDLKTGKAKPRTLDEAPDVAVDLQLGLYGLVARAMARAWGVPPRLGAAYVYTGHPTRPERAFDADHPLLEEAARQWLGTALHILQGRAFVRTPASSDCTWCKHAPVCGPDRNARASEVLSQRHADDTVEAGLEGLRALKGVGRVS